MLPYNNSVKIGLALTLATVSLSAIAEDPVIPATAPTAEAPKPTWEVKDMPAKRLWVSDRLEVPLRSCPGDKCRVVKVVRPGNEMNQIGYTADGWALVSAGEVKGYLPKRYLQDTPVASQQLEGAQRQSLEAVQAQQSLKTEMDTLKNRAQAAETEVGSLRKDNYELKQELEYVKTVSTQTLMVNEDNRRLKSEVEALRQRNSILEQEAADVEGKNQRAWVMVGAGILFIGWLIGRFARAPRRKGWNQI
jgi:SH3 domain protein